MEETGKIRKRCEIPVEDTWAIEDLYPTDEAWEQELAALQQAQHVLSGYAGKLSESGKTLYAYLSEMEQVNAKAERLGNYCMRRSDVDTRNTTYLAMSGKFMSAVVALQAACSFETPEIMAISEETLNGFYKECPELERYRRYLTDARRPQKFI